MKLQRIVEFRLTEGTWTPFREHFEASRRMAVRKNTIDRPCSAGTPKMIGKDMRIVGTLQKFRIDNSNAIAV